MWEALRKIAEKGVPSILPVLGALLLAFAFVDFSAAKDNWYIRPSHDVKILPCLIGVVALVGSVYLYLWQSWSGAWVRRRSVSRTSRGFAVALS
jgi:hypothetical protein